MSIACPFFASANSSGVSNGLTRSAVADDAVIVPSASSTWIWTPAAATTLVGLIPVTRVAATA